MHDLPLKGSAVLGPEASMLRARRCYKQPKPDVSLLQDERTNSKRRASTVNNADNTGGAPALPMPATEAPAEVETEAAKSSSATPIPANAAVATATSAPDAAQQASEANTALANTNKPDVLATAAASALQQAPDVSRQAAEKVMSQATPLVLKQEDRSTIADSPQGEEAAEQDLPGMTEPQQAASGAEEEDGKDLPGMTNPEGQEGQQMMMMEATEAADQLPSSYPATLISTLPCTVPAWLAQSQRITATAVMATQLAPTQVVQASVARLPATSAHTAVLTKCLMPSMSTGRARPHGALQDRPQTKLVSRLSQLGDTAPEGMPDQAIVQGAIPPCRDADRVSHASMSGPGKVAVQHPGHAELNVKAAEHSSAAKGPAALPDEARAAASSPSRQATERGKRAAERSPGAYDVAKVPHKRARSDSPTAKPDWLQSNGLGAQQKGPSDADVQVRGFPSSSIAVNTRQSIPAHCVGSRHAPTQQSLCAETPQLWRRIYAVILERLSQSKFVRPTAIVRCHEAMLGFIS